MRISPKKKTKAIVVNILVLRLYKLRAFLLFCEKQVVMPAFLLSYRSVIMEHEK